MKRFCLALVMVLLVTSAAAAQQIRIGGHGGNDTIIVEEMIELFVRPALEGTGITVQYEPVADDYQRFIVNALSAGTAPDLFYMDIFWAGSLIRSGAVEPLNDYLEKSTVLKAEDFIPSLVDAFTVDGQVYGIPKDFNTLALFYNKDLFDYAGVEYPSNDDTWDTLYEKLEKVASIDPDIYGLALQPEFARFGALAYAAGFTPFNAEGKTDLSDPAFVDAFKWYTGMAETGVGVMPADISQGWGGGALASEQVAAALEGAWIIGALKGDAPNLQYGATLMPKHPETGQQGNLIFTVAWGMNALPPIRMQLSEFWRSSPAKRFSSGYWKGAWLFPAARPWLITPTSSRTMLRPTPTMWCSWVLPMETCCPTASVPMEETGCSPSIRL